MRLLQVILGILLPPLGVYMAVGFSSALLFNIVLTLLGWLPGSIHAVWVIAKQAEREGEAEAEVERTYNT
ncbi:conserved exported hypothetical protein [Planktothrix serta PCC 8927]|uniref:Stress induced hydrophobic peptide n=1 Tax=Planktothrix serta PCC 8927 TaxID=671068 RepID=A0A7Z9E4T5_9CYAN|nr:YqaE/Pmp3 family membrane protein [Planktothrix serta]VXD23140.1 conserved exported hypothetical protein [Planktothrix serta PCC 8927]